MSARHHYRCSNCKQDLQVLLLSGHYDKPVEIDVCDHCGWIWFDETESVRLGGKGIATLVARIADAVRDAKTRDSAASMAWHQVCPVCDSQLKQTFNVSRFGRTSQLECQRGHGYYQSYLLYLAEKGYVRPIIWADLAKEGGRVHFCANCGGVLPDRPEDRCPHCQSAIAVFDSARLAMAIDPDGAADAGQARANHHCDYCGAPGDPTRDTRCRHCGGALLAARAQAASDTARTALEAIEQRDPRERTRRRLAALGPGAAPIDVNAEKSARRLSSRQIQVVGGLIVMALLFAFSYPYRKWMREPVPQAGRESPRNACLIEKERELETGVTAASTDSRCASAK